MLFAKCFGKVDFFAQTIGSNDRWFDGVLRGFLSACLTEIQGFCGVVAT
jgi:hypothetical protein